MSRAHRPSLAALLVAVATLVACSSGSTASAPTTTTIVRRGSVPVAVWSSRVCRAFDRWITALDTQSQQAADMVRGEPSQTARTAVVGLFEQGTRSTREYRETIRRSGAPAVERGLDLQDALTRRISRVERIMTSSRRRAASLPVSDAARFQLGLAELVNTHESAIISASRSFDRFDDQVDDPALRSALSAACGS